MIAAGDPKMLQRVPRSQGAKLPDQRRGKGGVKAGRGFVTLLSGLRWGGESRCAVILK